MNFGQYLAALAAAWAAFESGSPEPFKIGAVTVTAKLDANSNKLTIGEVVSAAPSSSTSTANPTIIGATTRLLRFGS